MRIARSDDVEGEEEVPKWEELVYTPAVFVRVANTGVTGYGTWKSAQGYENKGVEWQLRWSELAEELKSVGHHPRPWILKRYDSIRVRVGGSANDMIRKELGEWTDRGLDA